MKGDRQPEKRGTWEGCQPLKTCQDSRVCVDLCGPLGVRAGNERRWPYHRLGVKGSSMSLNSILHPLYPRSEPTKANPTSQDFPKQEALTKKLRMLRMARKGSANQTCQPKTLLQGKK